MKSTFSKIMFYASKLDSVKVQYIIMFVTLILFVLSAGAPGADGGIGK